MVWTYSGRPGDSSKDAVRFYTGDVEEERPLVSDEEILFVLTQQPIELKAAALVCQTISVKYSTKASMSVGDVSKQCSDIAKAFSDRAKELDKHSVGITSFVLPSFGGLSYAEKEVLRNNSDNAQPFFRRNFFEDGEIE